MDGRSMGMTAKSSLAPARGASAIAGSRFMRRNVVLSGKYQYNPPLEGLKTSSQLQYSMSGMQFRLRAMGRVWERKPGDQPITILCCR